MKQKKYYICVVAATLVLMAASVFTGIEKTGLGEGGGLVRGSPGEGEKEISLKLEVPQLEKKDTYQLVVGERECSKEEREALFDRAVEELEEGFAAEGEELDHITEPVCLFETLQDGRVLVEWEFGEPAVICVDGSIDRQHVKEEGTMTMVRAKLSYREYDYFHEFAVCVYPRQIRGMTDLKEEISKYFEEEEKNGESELSLPGELAGYELRWSIKKDQTPWQILGLGVAALFVVHFGAHENELKKRSARKQELEREYPVMVSQFALLFGAGMTIKAVFERITEQYLAQVAQKKRKNHVLYEEMLMVLNRISDGVGERRAYEEFADRLGLAPYRRFSMLLIQNLQKGNRGLGELLAREADQALEERKNQARRRGEEAGTKLLLPMMMMLVIVVAIMLIPACMTMEIY